MEQLTQTQKTDIREIVDDAVFEVIGVLGGGHDADLKILDAAAAYFRESFVRTCEELREKEHELNLTLLS